MPSGFQSPPPQLDFGNTSSWEIMASEKEKEEDQEFNYQNPITENLEVEILNIQIQQTPNNLNPKLINQKNLPPEIAINQQPINLIAEQPQQLPILSQPLSL
ncbi:hypothetical protein G9A89_008223 [Geosiphon pyriformis]|nr:hypothetical protein G9A89_008223 [Geosiphon pyriformis]